jgi:VWFA-related protein
MHKQIVSLLLLIVGVTLSTGMFRAVAMGQATVQEKRKLKDFGSSLKRLKWDSKRNAAVPTTRPKARETKNDEVEVVRVDTTLVTCDVMVLDRNGRPVQGLTGEDFVVVEDGREQDVGLFSLGDDPKIPRSIVLVLDYSLNQSGFLVTSVEAAKTLVSRLGPLDRLAIVTDEIELLSDFETDKQKLKDKLDSLLKRPAFPQQRAWFPDPDAWMRRGAHFSALLATLNEAFDAQDQRPIIVFQANGNEISMMQNSILAHPPVPPDNLDGAERKEAEEHYQRIKRHVDRISNRRQFSLDDVYKAAEKSRATIYSIIPGYRLLGMPTDRQIRLAKLWTERYRLGWNAARRRTSKHLASPASHEWTWPWAVDCLVKEQGALATLAGMTGGWADFLEDPGQAEEIYSRILSDMNRRYIVGYYPTNKERDGKRRTVKVSVRAHPEYAVVGRKSYYAPNPD